MGWGRKGLGMQLRKRAVSDYLTERCNVVAATKGASDGRGGWAEGLVTTVYNNIPCAIEAPNRETAVSEETRQRLRGRTLVTILLQPDRVITMGQRIVRGNESYEVIGSPVGETDGLTLAFSAARNTP